MKSILMLLALAFLVFQIKADPEPEQEPETLDISNENDSHESEEEEPHLDFLTENETTEPLDDSEEEDAIIQSGQSITCRAAGATCRRLCLSRERVVGYCRTNVRCCLRYK